MFSSWQYDVERLWGGQSPRRQTRIQVDINGATAGGATIANSFDWLPGNAMIVEGLVGGPVTVLYQANLNSVVGTPSILNDTQGGFGFDHCRFDFTAMQTGPGTFLVLPGGTFQIYAGTSPAPDLAGGTAFSNENLILTGTATGTG